MILIRRFPPRQISAFYLNIILMKIPPFSFSVAENEKSREEDGCQIEPKGESNRERFYTEETPEDPDRGNDIQREEKLRQGIEDHREE